MKLPFVTAIVANEILVKANPCERKFFLETCNKVGIAHW